MNTICNQLDDYLDGDLAIDEVARFENHLNECSICCGTVQEHQRVSELLVGAWKQVDETPQQRVAIEGQKASWIGESRVHRRRRVGYFSFVATIAASLLAMTVYVGLNPQSFKGDLAVESMSIDQGKRDESAPAGNSNQVRVSDVSFPSTEVIIRGNAIGLPIVEDDDFTLIMVYPTATQPEPTEKENPQ